MVRILFLLFISSFLFLTPFHASAQEERAAPRSGEGISAFLQRNKRPGKAYYLEFLELNKKQLRGKQELHLGVKYLLPPLKSKTETAANSSTSSVSAAGSGKTIHEPLFGKIGNVELHEDEYAYDVALRLARNLMEEGAKVYIIIQDAKDGIRDDRYLNNSKRETCMGDAIPLNQVARLRQRCIKINELYRKDRKNYTYCRSIFLHVDSRSKRHQMDVFFYHAPNSKRLATTMKNTFESKYDKHQPNRGFTGTVGPRNLYVLANSTPAGVFVELGNIQNTFDQRRFVISSNRQALAKWMMEGFITDYKKSK